MKHNWNIAKLEEHINLRKSFIEIDNFKRYKLCRIQTQAKGIILREEKIGFDIKTKKQQLCKTGDFIVAEMDARYGGYGLLPNELNGAIVSSHYFIYEINEKTLDKTFLSYYSKTPHFFKQVSAQGSTNYAAIRSDHVLNYLIPLPPLPEQKRIVAILDSVKERIDEIKRLRQEQVKEIENFRYSLMCDIENENKRIRIDSFCEIKKGSFAIMKTEAGEFPFVVTAEDFKTANSYDFDCEAVCIPLVSSTGHGNAALHRVHYYNGKFALSNLLCAVTPKNKNSLDVKFLYELCMAKRNDYFVPLMKGTSNVSLSIDKIGSVEIPIPSIKEQKRIIEILDKFRETESCNQKNQKELDQLMPSLMDKAFKGEL